MTFDIRRVRAALPGREIWFFDSLDSTMREASDLARQGARHGDAVVAEEQTAGQGRHGRSWHSEAGSGLYVSIILRPNLAPDSLPPLTMALGLAAAEAIARSTDLECDLRWPNDLMLGNRKLAGILVQMEDKVVIAGIGINVNHAAFPADLANEATSLRIATGRRHAPEDLLVELLHSALRFSKMLEEGGKHLIFDLFSRRSSYAAGKPVSVDRPGGRVEGVTAGLDPNGFLRVRLANGAIETIVAGGVRALSA